MQAAGDRRHPAGAAADARARAEVHGRSVALARDRRRTAATRRASSRPKPCAKCARRWGFRTTDGGHRERLACGSGRTSSSRAQRCSTSRQAAAGTRGGSPRGGTRCSPSTGTRRRSPRWPAPSALQRLSADLENAPWPLKAGDRFAAVVVTNYLHRPLFRASVVDALAPGGVLLYETFAAGNESVGKPSNPAFLLKPGELIDAAARRRCGSSLIRMASRAHAARILRAAHLRESARRTLLQPASPCRNNVSIPPRYDLAG